MTSHQREAFPFEKWAAITDFGFTAADIALQALGLEHLKSAAWRSKLNGLFVLWHPAR